MKAKKLVAVGMTVLMLGGLFVGCGNSADTSTGANSGKNVKITIFQSKIEANEGYKKLIAAYEKDHPNVEINLEAVTGNDFGASMKAKMQSDPPTIFSVGGFSDMKDYGDVIEDVSDLDIMQHALKGTTDTFTKDGKVYAIPLYMEGYGFVINKQMFEDAGVSVDSMMNFEGMKAGFDTLKEKIDNGEMKDKYPNLEAVMEYPTKELWIAGDHDANVALTHDFKTPNEAYAADSLPGTGFEDYKKMVDFQASYTTNANNTANLNSVDYTTSLEGGLPLMMPAFTIGLFLSISSSFKMFDQNLALTQGGPYKSTEMIALNIYNSAFGANEFGFAQAKAIVFLIIVAGIGVTQLVITKRKEVEM